MLLPGTPSDELADVLATGSGDITTAFVSMATRHPDGTDAEYLQWHTLDHRPEQHRLSAVRASLRLVSTPACRAARAVKHERFDSVDHVMTYFFSDTAGLDGFLALVRGADRRRSQTPPLAARRTRRLRGAEQSLPRRASKSAPMCCRGGRPAACTCCWKTHAAPPVELLEIEGVAGIWSTGALDVGPQLASAPAGQQLTYCFLDEDPVATAARLRPVLEKRWKTTDIDPLFAAPFHPVVPYEWSRYVP